MPPLLLDSLLMDIARAPLGVDAKQASCLRRFGDMKLPLEDASVTPREEFVAWPIHRAREHPVVASLPPTAGRRVLAEPLLERYCLAGVCDALDRGWVATSITAFNWVKRSTEGVAEAAQDGEGRWVANRSTLAVVFYDCDSMRRLVPFDSLNVPKSVLFDPRGTAAFVARHLVCGVKALYDEPTFANNENLIAAGFPHKIPLVLRSVTAAEFVPAAKLSTPPISVNFVPEAFNAILSHPELSFVIEMPEEEVPLTFHAAVMSPARRELTISSDNDQEITYAKIGGGWALITARHIDGMTTRFVTNLPPNGLQGQHLVDAVAPLTATRDDDGLRQQRRDISEHLSRNWIRAKDPRPYECALVAAESMNVTGN